MARVNGYFPFKVCHATNLVDVGQLVYMQIWSSKIGEIICTGPETKEEVKQYDKFSVAIQKDADHKILADQVPNKLIHNWKKTSRICFVCSGKFQL